MRWWDDLWLNESFATLMEYIAVDSIYPEWDVMLSFASHEALGAFKRDSLPGVQAVKTDVRHPDEISTLFDPSIVYAKGARLLLMAYTFVGKSAFQKGLKNYFKNHAYGNTEGKDLWTELDKASGKDVSGLMKKWITQPGFPLVTVDQTDATLRIQQVPFFDATNNQTWPTPLTVHPKIDEELLTKKAITLAAPASFVRLNTAGGHFSVRYANPLHQNYLAAQIAKSKLPTTERFLILNDSLMQAKKGVGAITETLTLLTGFKNEESEPVWSVITSVIGEVKRFIDADSPEEKQFKNFVADLVQNQYTRLGVRKKRDESLNDTKLRSIILGLAAYSEKKVFVTELLTEYKKYDSIHKIPADTRTILLDVAIRNGAKSNFTKLLKMYPNEQNAELQQDICSALTSTKDPDHIKQAIKKLKDASYVRPQDVARWYIYLLTNRHAKKATWKWLTSNWKWIEKNFGSDKSYDNYPRYSASAFSTNDWLKEYKAFFGPLKKEPSLTRNIELGTEEIKTRIAWQKRDGKKLVTWLADFS
jgi:aminopeptidase N